MKKLLFMLLLLFPLFSYSQEYPFKTLYHKDSVIIMTSGQYIEINKLIDDQAKKILELEDLLNKGGKENEKLCNNINSLNGIINKNNFTIDTLEKVNLYYSAKIDSFDKEAIRIKNWLLDAAITNTFIYLDWDEYAIKIVNLNAYKCSRDMFGRFIFTPLNISNFDDYKKYRIKNRISPNGDLNKLYQMESPIKIEYIQWQE